MLPPTVKCDKAAQAVLIDCCVEFIHLVSSEANEICENSQRKTISPEHLVAALEVLGFSEFLEEVKASWEDHKIFQKEREKMVKKHFPQNNPELAQTQEELFAKAVLEMRQNN